MKLIETILRPNKLDDVKNALDQLQVPGITVTEVRGHGRQKAHTAVYRGREYEVGLLPKIELEVVVADDLADETVRVVLEAARTGGVADGRVFVFPVAETYRIRTGDRLRD